MKLECLKDIVGITNTDCECLIGELTTSEIEAIRVSKSGLYLDQLPGSVPIKTYQNIDKCKVFAEIALEQRDIAIADLEQDLKIGITAKFQSNKNRYQGRIGQMAFTKPLSTSGIYVGLRITPEDVHSDGVLRIPSGEICVSATTTVSLKVIAVPYGSNTGDIVAELDVQTVAGARKSFSFPQPLDLRLYKNRQDTAYFIVYDKTQLNGGQPMDNAISCGCGQEKELLKYVSIDGVQINSLTSLNSISVQNKYTHGLILNVDAYCDKGTFICREFDANDAVSATLAKCVQYKANEYIIQKVLDSTELSREILVSRENLYGKRNHFAAEYQSRMKWLLSDDENGDPIIDIDSTDCFICNEHGGAWVDLIRS